MVARWLQAWLDSCMQRWGIKQQARRITLYYLGLLGEQLSAMLPLSLLQVCVPLQLHAGPRSHCPVEWLAAPSST